jgi:hypothetical protein
MQKSSRRPVSLTIATVLTSLFDAPSFGAVVAATGGPLLQVDTRANASIDITSSPNFVNLPGAQVKVTIPPAGGSRLIVARFAAKADCSGSTGQNCSVQIIALNSATGTVTEMHPQAGVTFIFDSVTSTADGPEAHAMERSLRLNPGTYFIRVRFAVSDASAAFLLDDWHLTVEQYD